MGTLTTKYDVGQTVWYATTISGSRRLPCPDCLGSRRWQAISPAGRGYLFDCPRCSRNYQSDRNLSLDVYDHKPHVERVTIQQIGWDTHGSAPQATYMPWKSPGGGSVYRENDLHESEEAALAAATLKAAEHNAHWNARPDVFKGHIEVADYQIDLASAKAAQKEARDLKYEIQYLVEDLVELATEASEFEWDKITPVKLMKAVKRRFEKMLPDDLEIDEDADKVRLNECSC